MKDTLVEVTRSVLKPLQLKVETYAHVLNALASAGIVQQALLDNLIAMAYGSENIAKDVDQRIETIQQVWKSLESPHLDRALGEVTRLCK